MTPLASLAPEDLAQIAQVWHAALGDAAQAPPPAALLQRLTGDLSGCEVALAQEAGRIVGFVACDLQQRWLRQLFVHPAHQGAGVGSRLLTVAMQAMPAGWLRTDATNQAARHFYAKRGLRQLRSGPHPVSGEPAVQLGWP